MSPLSHDILGKERVCLLLGRVVGEGNALADVALKAFNCLLQESLLLSGNALQRVVGLLSTVGLRSEGVSKAERVKEENCTYAELDGNREEVDTSLLGNGLTSGDTGEVDVAGLNEALLTLDGAENLLSEATFIILSTSNLRTQTLRCNIPETSISHGERGGTSTSLGLNDLITTKLNAVDQGVVLVIRDGDRGRDLAEKGNNGLAGVSADDGDCEILGLRLASDTGNEGLSTDDVEGGDTEEALGVENVLGLENLGGDGHSRVDWVRDDQDEGLGGNLGSSLDETLNNAGVDVEEIITGHTRLAYYMLACQCGGASLSRK